MTDNTDPIDDIVVEAHRLGVKDTVGLKKAITTEILKARIDEQEKAYFGWQQDHAEFEIWNDARIAALQKQLNELEGE